MCIYNSKKVHSAAEEESLNMVVSVLKNPSKTKVLDTYTEESPTRRNKKIGKDFQDALNISQKESRVIIGVPEAVKYLSVAPEETLFCVLAPPKKGDSATHMQEVLLKAFCFENDIYIIQVDSAEKLGRLLNMSSSVTCILIQKSRLKSRVEERISDAEDSLVDYCEDYWDSPQQPIVQLPDDT